MSRLETLPDALIEKLRRREFAIGEVIGERYRLKSLLGMGAMGQVFVADNTAIGVEVAVKLLKAELIADAEFRQRFQKEAEAVGAIAHQNVARFFDLVVGDPTFLVMEHVRGPTLEQVLAKEKQLTPERAIRIAVRLCWGLQAAHARGIVHRDLKPANIILSSDPEVGEQPKIIDFGLAKLAARASKAELTRTGQILGTPEYMAPEQIEGAPIDARADVYALGCVLFKMIAGRTPFAGDEDIQVLYRQMHKPAMRLSELVPAVTPKLDEVVARALAKNPADRYADTRELAEALSRSHDRRKDSSPAVAQAPAAHHPPLALMLATALAVGAAGGVLFGRTLGSGTVAHDHVAAAAPAPPVPAKELVVVSSRPPGANVAVDGKPVAETTPTAIRGISPGEHVVKLSAPGLTTVERNVVVARDGRVAVFVNLPGAQRSVLVHSVPDGAMVYLDGTLVGPTPTSVVVSEDDFHGLRLEKLGFATVTRKITPDDHDTDLTLTMELDPNPHSEIAVDSRDEAEIWVDGVDTGLATPAEGLRVDPGRHTLQLKDSSGATSRPTTITIKAGETQHVVMNL